MKNSMPSVRLTLFTLFIASQGFFGSGFAQHMMDVAEPEPYRGDFAIKGDQFAIWNGFNYIPVFIKGINLGVAVPGTQPGELAATAEDYRRWFDLIKEAGYNTIRLYTLHYPRFYQELRTYNLEHPQNPLLVIHGVWLEENETAADLYGQTAFFDNEIREVVSAVHGDISIAHRFGKAYGDFNSDISPWVLAYLPGREIYPSEVRLSNEAHPGETSYDGVFFRLQSGDPVEVWLAQRLDGLLQYEQEHYQSIRPCGFSSWPTLDPIYHPTEHLLEGSSEDLEQIDLANLLSTENSPGFFIGYHAYPYYPDFIVQDPSYLAESDSLGPNNYLGYLMDLKAHYQDIPLIIAEFGVPSSWGSGHLSPSGMHHGGISEEEQGRWNIRMFDNIEHSGCAGGLQFSLIDEWFKQTWITNPYSDKQYRYLWHNITSPEQNFGILAYAPPPAAFTETASYPDSSITSIQVHSDYTFFRVRLLMKTALYMEDTLWVAFDTYESNLGESVLPDGQSIGVAPDTLRAEFALRIPMAGEHAQLYVIPSYDVFGVKDPDRLDTVVSAASDAGLWNPVKWQTSYFYNSIQYIGELNMSSSEDPYQFLNAVTLFNDSMEIRIPWTLINFPAPTVGRAMHYQSHMEGQDLVIDRRDTLSDGIAVSVVLQEDVYQSAKYQWSPWDYEQILSEAPIERKKQTFHYMKQRLPLFNSPPIGLADTFHLNPGDILEPGPEMGLLRNDFDIDGNTMQVRLPFGSITGHGSLFLHPDGSFLYDPDPGFQGSDFFMYYLEDGAASSALVPVLLEVRYPLYAEDELLAGRSSVYPNPGRDRFHITIREPFREAQLKVVDMLGKEILLLQLEEARSWIEIENIKPGVYLFILNIDQNIEQYRIIIQ
ncbi:MAG: Ig-like domain-containing protein [Bacteroidales bacterium]|nr:Ig-like domain-containing protein [Bacteroidales bacterium]